LRSVCGWCFKQDKKRQMNTAVLFLVFKRPAITVRTFEAIRAAAPTRLYIASDGPRVGSDSEVLAVQQVRSIVSNVDWDCTVKHLFRDQNLGCKLAITTAIDWFFANEQEGIILEDDCLPHADFFPFCESLLKRYRSNESVWMITGNNFQNGIKRGVNSFYFSKYPHTWGWATWRRCWKHFDAEIKFWPEWKKSRDFREKVPLKKERLYWAHMFDKVHSGTRNIWDFQWVATVWRAGGLTATPQVNLVTNIGVGEDATHTKIDSPMLRIPTSPLKLSEHDLSDSNYAPIRADECADRHNFESVFKGGGGIGKRKSILRSLSLFLQKIKRSSCL